MRGFVPRAVSWMAAQWWRLRVLGDDARRAAGGLVAAARRARHAPPVHPCIAILAGDAFARPGSWTPYRVRVHNPCADAREVVVDVRGRRDDGANRFAVRWTALVPAAGVTERWVSTDWRDEARIDPSAPAALPPLVHDGVRGGWRVEASVADAGGQPLHALAIGGDFVA